MHIYNVCPQREDPRDFKLRMQPAQFALPQRVDLRAACPPVFNQGDLGSCTANAGVAARMMLGDIKSMLSRLFLYYKERELEGTVAQDSGATMRSICKALHKYGVCRELFWPYIVTRFAQRPNFIADLDARGYRISAYRSFDSNSAQDEIDQIRQYLAIKKQPVLAGVTIYASFESLKTTRTGVIPVPDPSAERELGGHALLIVGYDDAKSWFIVRNSWGKAWGDKGYGYMPYGYILGGFGYDFWVLE
ncbi:MAG: C1 family peptidase [Oscillospiraceae bacterium]|nr:C1 family peptidase [Oscillospiraceae bacterium]